MSNKDHLRYAGRKLARRTPTPGAVAEHTRKLRALVAERQGFVAARTPKY